MPLFVKMPAILMFTIGAIVVSPLTLTLGIWLSDAALPLIALTLIAIGGLVVVRRLALSR